MASKQQNMNNYGVAWWKFDEESGDVLDSKGSYTGVCTGITRVRGLNGNALSFSGSNSYVSFNSKIVPIGKKSIRFRIKVDNPPSTVGYILANLNSYASKYGMTIDVRTSGKLMFTIAKASSTNFVFMLESVTNVCDGKWHDVLFTWDGTTNQNGIKIYIDDFIIPDTVGTASSLETVAPSENLVLGKVGSSSANYFKGELDEFEIYSDVVEFSEIKYLVKSSDVFKTLIDNTWANLEITNLTSNDFNIYGLNDVTNITNEKWSELIKPVEIYVWTDDIKISNVSINFDYKEFVKPKIELTIPETKLIDQLERPISILTYVKNKADVPRLKQEYNLKSVGTRIMKRG